MASVISKRAAEIISQAEARRQFFARLETLYEREGGGMDFEMFRYETVKKCKEYLKKN